MNLSQFKLLDSEQSFSSTLKSLHPAYVGVNNIRQQWILRLQKTQTLYIHQIFILFTARTGARSAADILVLLASIHQQLCVMTISWTPQQYVNRRHYSLG
jgi:hypothetical protein